jgi:hypothetical protein
LTYFNNLLYSPSGEAVFVEVSDKEISEIKMNSDQENTKELEQKY